MKKRLRKQKERERADEDQEEGRELEEARRRKTTAKAALTKHKNFTLRELATADATCIKELMEKLDELGDEATEALECLREHLEDRKARDAVQEEIDVIVEDIRQTVSQCGDALSRAREKEFKQQQKQQQQRKNSTFVQQWLLR
jgi:hypothetical protein